MRYVSLFALLCICAVSVQANNISTLETQKSNLHKQLRETEHNLRQTKRDLAKDKAYAKEAELLNKRRAELRQHESKNTLIVESRKAASAADNMVRATEKAVLERDGQIRKLARTVTNLEDERATLESEKRIAQFIIRERGILLERKGDLKKMKSHADMADRGARDLMNRYKLTEKHPKVVSEKQLAQSLRKEFNQAKTRQVNRDKVAKAEQAKIKTIDQKLEANKKAHQAARDAHNKARGDLIRKSEDVKQANAARKQMQDHARKVYDQQTIKQRQRVKDAEMALNKSINENRGVKRLVDQTQRLKKQISEIDQAIRTLKKFSKR